MISSSSTRRRACCYTLALLYCGGTGSNRALLQTASAFTPLGNSAATVAVQLSSSVSPTTTLPGRRQFITSTPVPTTTTTATTTTHTTFQRMSSTISNTGDSTTSDGIPIGENLALVRQEMAQACQQAKRDLQSVRLVAVSKTKPIEYVQLAYKHGQRVFGENYAQELVEKAQEMKEFTANANDNDNGDVIQWHFIGGLQSNKVNMLVKGVVPYGKLVIETVASLKVAKKLDNAMADFDNDKIPLEIFVQVNTSGEDSKSGVTVEEAVELCQQIAQECSRIHLKGVMTIGAPGDVSCLEKLVECRDKVAAALDKDPKELEVSMGMSDDFAVAIQKGSTNIRVGSTIFGARDYSNIRK